MAGKHNDLNDFVTHIKDVGLPTASHYQVTLPDFISGINSRNIVLLCDTVDMPGISVMTQELRTMGEVSEMPYGITYPPVSMTFFIDNKFDARKYFTEWSQLVYNRTTRTLGYYDQYAQEITIEALDKSGNIIYNITLIEAYPKSVDNISFNNSNHDVLKLNVQFTYKYHKENIEKVTPYKKETPDYGLSFEPEKQQPGLETLGNPAKDSWFNFDNADNNSNIGSKLSKFGPNMGTEINRACKAVSASSLGASAPGNPTFGSSFGSAVSSIGNSVAGIGSVLGDVGKVITNATAPISAVGGAVNSLSNTVGALDSVMKSVGIDSGLGSVTKDLRKIGGTMGMANMKINGFTGPLGALGGSMGALGTSFGVISKSFETMSGVPDQMKKTTSKLGDLFSKKGNETTDAASEMKTQIDNGTI